MKIFLLWTGIRSRAQIHWVALCWVKLISTNLLVVIQHGVHALNPQSVNRSVEYDPLLDFSLICCILTERVSYNTICPLTNTSNNTLIPTASTSTKIKWSCKVGCLPRVRRDQTDQTAAPWWWPWDWLHGTTPNRRRITPQLQQVDITCWCLFSPLVSSG